MPFGGFFWFPSATKAESSGTERTALLVSNSVPRRWVYQFTLTKEM
jgi:hypothetical protein